MGYVKRKGTTKVNTKLPEERFQQMKASFLQQTVAVVTAHNIPPQLIINLDETGVQLVPVGKWTMAPEGSKRVEVTGLDDKRQITATFAAALDGTMLPMQLLYQGKTDRCHPKFTFPAGFHVSHTPNHWANEITVKAFYEKVIVSYVENIRSEKQIPTQKALVIMDNFSAHSSGDALQQLEENGVLVVFLPANTTDRLQPLDLSINKAAKDHLRDKFRRWYAGEVAKGLKDQPETHVVPVEMGMAIMKELGAQWLVSFYDYICSHTELVRNGFKEAGIIEALEKGPSPPSPHANDDNDPFLDLDSD